MGYFTARQRILATAVYTAQARMIVRSEQSIESHQVSATPDRTTQNEGGFLTVFIVGGGGLEG